MIAMSRYRQKTSRLTRPSRSKVSQLALATFVLLLSLQASGASGLQFVLKARSKRCFREDVPLSTDVVISYTIAQGKGDMPVTVQVTDAGGKEHHRRVQAEHGVLTIRSADHPPTARAKSGWALREDQDELEQSLFRLAADDGRVAFFVCFEHARSYMPALHREAQPVQRRIFLDVSFGAAVHDRGFYDALAKEKHLSSTEELFRVVEDRVNDVVRLIDEMRERDLRMTHINDATGRSLALYSLVACIFIAGAAAVASYSSLSFLAIDKRLR